MFPDPKSPYRLWPNLSWTLAIPALVCALLDGIWVALILHGVNLSNWLAVTQWLPAPILIAWNFVMVSLGFVNCFRKYQGESDPVQRRSASPSATSPVKVCRPHS